MHNVLPLALVFGSGILLGAFYFGGLWWTVQKGVASARPALWFLGSLLLRTGVVLAGFFFVGQGDWKRLFVGLFGFIVCRIIIIRLTGRAKAPVAPREQEARHAS